MSTKLNSIETNIKQSKSASNLSNEELIFYLYETSKDPQLKTFNENNIINYFNKIQRSFLFENIFIVKSNYSQLSIWIIGLLIPFYINYPRMYNLGLTGFLIGAFSLFSLYMFTNNLYGTFFPYAGILFFILSVIFYFVFFILFNKLNHISLFFISCVVSFCIINFILYIAYLIIRIFVKTIC